MYYKSQKHLVVEYEGNFTFGVKDGLGTLFHDNGNLYFKGNFKKDQPFGEDCTIYDEDELLWYEGAMVDGKKVNIL